MSDEQAQNLYRDMRERFAALPGVTSSSFSSFALVEGSDWTTLMRLDPDQTEKSIEVDMMAPGPNFLETMRIPLLAGRTFTAQDFQVAAKKNGEIRDQIAVGTFGKPSTAGASESIALPALVNRAFVEKYLANENPLGRGLYAGARPGDSQDHGTPSREWEIVGVVGNTTYDTMRDAEAPLFFVPDASGGAEFELRTAGDPNALVPVVRDAMAKMNGEVPLIDIRTQTEQIDRELLEERFLAKLVSVVGLLAMVLACVGLYGLLSYEVSRRTREIGVRMALGAARLDVFRLVLGQGLVLAIAGVVLGAAIAAGLTRFLESLLFGVKPNDPVTFAAIAGLILAVGALASYLPTRRATRVDPMVALRYE
jgi:predicted permease